MLFLDNCIFPTVWKLLPAPCYILQSPQAVLGLEQGASAKISPPTKKRHGGHSSLKSSIHPNLYQQYSQTPHKTDNFAGLRVEHENGWGPHETLVGFGHSVIFGPFTICGSFTAPEGHSEEWHHADRRQYGLRGNMAIQMLGP